MIPIGKERRILRLLKKGLSAKAIAEKVGVSTSTVNKTAARGYVRARPKKKPPPPKQVKPYSCECGFTVNLKPCQICAAQASKKEGVAILPDESHDCDASNGEEDPSPAELLASRLSPEEQARKDAIVRQYEPKRDARPPVPTSNGIRVVNRTYDTIPRHWAYPLDDDEE